MTTDFGKVSVRLSDAKKKKKMGKENDLDILGKPTKWWQPTRIDLGQRRE